jgi:hypothetical protein
VEGVIASTADHRTKFKALLDLIKYKFYLIYQWQGCNPSGGYLTTLINTVINKLLALYVSHNIAANHFNTTRVEFDDIGRNIRFGMFGDDCVVVVSEEYQFITQEAMTIEFSKIGLKFTDDEKKGLVHQHRDITEGSILKRKFRYDSYFKCWVAPLELKVILESPYWHKKNVPPDHWFQCLHRTLCELALHGEKVYNALAPSIELEFTKVLETKSGITDWRDAFLRSRQLELEY